MANPFEDDMDDLDCKEEDKFTSSAESPVAQSKIVPTNTETKTINYNPVSVTTGAPGIESTLITISSHETSMAPTVPDPAIKEGLLCPMCMAEFGTINGLQEHFQSSHANLTDASGFTEFLGSQWKGLMTKAKSKAKILKNGISLSDDPMENAPANPNSSASTNNNGGLVHLNSLSSINQVAEFREFLGNNQHNGRARSHWEQFKSIRDGRIERTVMETNKLLIRLDKLVTDPPIEPDRRKAHEKSVVSWACDDDVRLCPSCAKSFNLSRRRHHCRLCGAIMCHHCSHFLEHDLAHRLVGPTPLDSATPLRSLTSSPKHTPTHGPNSQTTSSASNSLNPNTQLNKALSLIPSIGKRGSANSLLALVNGVTGQNLSVGGSHGVANEMWPQVRLCTDCMKLIDRRIDQIDERLAKPPICKLYQEMTNSMAEAEKLAPIYAKMAVSLSIGESDYDWKDAFGLRIKVMRLAERIDLCSKKISVLGSKDEPPPNRKQIQLQGRVRIAVTQFLKDKLVALPSLPTEDECLKQQEKYRKELRKQLEAERMAIAAQSLGHNNPTSNHSSASRTARSHSKSPSPSTTRNGSLSVAVGSLSLGTSPQVSHEEGWGTEQPRLPPSIKAAMTAASTSEAVNPMLLQINIIRGYIKQARDAHKYDEVRMLEENLKDLEIEYLLQEQEEQQELKGRENASKETHEDQSQSTATPTPAPTTS